METLSLSLSQYLFHFPAARKRKTIARHRFSSFLYLSRIGNDL